MTRAELSAAGVELSRPEHARVARFVELLLALNEHINLTGTRAPDEFWKQHVVDSLMLLGPLRSDLPRRVVDLGTGGGLPGLPLACVLPEVQFTLVDSTRKKLAAVQQISEDLELRNVAFVWGRAESLAHESRLRERSDALTARAVARLPLLLELAAGFVRPFGRLLLMKSVPALEQEFEAGQAVAGKLGLKHRGTHRYALPEPHGERVVIEYAKVRALDARLPRRQPTAD